MLCKLVHYNGNHLQELRYETATYLSLDKLPKTKWAKAKAVIIKYVDNFDFDKESPNTELSSAFVSEKISIS